MSEGIYEASQRQHREGELLLSPVTMELVEALASIKVLEAEVATLKSYTQSNTRRCLTCYYGAQASDLEPCSNCAKTYLMNWKEGEQE